MNGKINPYEVLEVSPRANQSVITAAYRALSNIHRGPLPHNKSAQKTLDEAYELLSASASREEYDKSQRQRGGKMIGPYRLIEVIAEGGFGRTYKAEHSELHELVCIKDCSNVAPQYTWILDDEAKAMWDLRHYAIPAIRDRIKLEDGRIALVMSYIPGLTIEKIVEKVGKLPAEHVAWITERVLNALSYIHHNGVVHGDIKPQNIIVQPEKHMATVVDFGLSMIKPTIDSVSKGHTEVYAPPEEIEGKPIVPESDFYSLGMTMIYALSGDIEAVKQKRVPKDVPEELCDFIKPMIARSIEGRPTWEKEDLCESIRNVRSKAFGRKRSGMKPIEGL